MSRLTRRVLLAGASALSPGAAATPPPVRLPRKLRLGLIGTEGHTGEILGPLPRLPDIEVVAITASDPKALQRLQRNPHAAKARLFPDYPTMLDQEKLDLVAVCNNNGERAAAVRACADRKLNVIAEKPLAITRSDFNRVRQAVQSSGIRLGMLLPMRFEPPYLALRRLVESGELGDIIQIASQKSYKAGERDAWYRHRETYGSTILWIGIHMIDLMRWTSGREFRQAAGFASHIGAPELGDMDNVTASLFRLDNGGVATLRMDYLRSPQAATHGDDRLRLAGTRGIAEYQASTGVTLMTNAAAPRVIDPLPEHGSVFLDYLEGAYNGKPPVVTLDDIWRVNEITFAAHEAATAGRFLAT